MMAILGFSLGANAQKNEWFLLFNTTKIIFNRTCFTANEMAYLANKGWYKIPHIVDSIEGGDKFGMLAKFNEQHKTVDIPDSVFEVVHDGMQGVVERGTGVGAKVDSIIICGKTGTVENYFRGVKQQNHSFFCAFAPRENPKIAIMCVVENSGHFGGTYAAPIVGLMIEKYLKDSITNPKRKAQVESLSKLNLIPPRIYKALRTQDSLMHGKDSAYLIEKGFIKIIKDTMGLDEEDNTDDLKKLKEAKQKEAADKKKQQDKKENRDVKQNTDAILPEEQKMPAAKDSTK
jgi:penicillin-binding protein 2